MTSSSEGSGKPSEDKKHGYNNKSGDANKGPGTSKITENPTENYFEPEDFQEIPDYTIYNPLSDFIYINGHSYAIRSALSRVPVAMKDKSNQVEIELKTVWKTDYIDEKGELHIVRMNKLGFSEDKIGGHNARPIFSAEYFKDAIEKYRGLLKHTNRLSKDPLKSQDLKEVFRWVTNAVRSVLTVSEDDLRVISCWIIAAHFHRVFNQFPPLIFGKPGFDAGGTVVLTATSLIPSPVTIFDPTAATLYRLSQMGFSLQIDEIDPEDKEKVAALNLITDGSFNKDAGIPRASGKGYAVEGFMTYGPKVGIDPKMAIVKYSTLSRSIRSYLEKDPKRSETLNASEFIDKYRYLIDYLYGLFLPYAHRVRRAYDEIDDIKGRQRQAYSPVLAIAKLVECKDDVLRTLSKTIQNSQMQKEGDLTKFVLRSLYIYLIERRSGMEFTEFSQDRQTEHWYIQLSKLRDVLKERVSETHQTDESTFFDRYGEEHTNKRQWKKIPPEYKTYFEGKKFNGIVMAVLGKWVKRVRADRYGLQVDSHTERGEPLDPILDELEKVLEIENSYKQSEDGDSNDKEDNSDYKCDDSTDTDLDDLGL